MSTPILLDNLDLLPIYHHIGPGMIGMILSKGINPSENLGVSSFPSHPVLPLLSCPFSFPSPPSLPFPRRPHPVNQLGGLGSTVSSPRWWSGAKPQPITIWCISGPKGAALFCVSFFVGNTGPSYHSLIVCEND